MMRFFLIFMLFFAYTGSANTSNLLHIPYYGQTIEVKVRGNFPVSLRFEELIQQVRWDPQMADFKYQPEISKNQKFNNITFFLQKIILNPSE